MVAPSQLLARGGRSILADALSRTGDTSAASNRAARAFRGSRPRKGTIQAHLTGEDRVLLRYQDWDARRKPEDVVIELHNELGKLVRSWRAEEIAWLELGNTGPRARSGRTTWIALVEVGVRELARGGPDRTQVYVGHALRDRGRTCVRLASCRFEAPRLWLPTSEVAPYVVFLGSCMDVETDGDEVDEVYPVIRRIRRSLQNAANAPDGLRPSLSVFLGDQVYADQSHWEFKFRNSMLWLWNHWQRKYDRSWIALDAIMADSLNVCMSSDHEYWNDFPNLPVQLAWPALHDDSEYRRDVRSVAVACAESIQGVEPLRRHVVHRGPAFHFLETSRWRMPRSRQFCEDVHLDQLIDALNGRYADRPNVIALGQPIFDHPLSSAFASLGVGDRHLPSHRRQYSKLARAIATAPHDVVVVAGDPHFSRVSMAEFPTPPHDRRAVHRVIEVVASPLEGLKSSPGYFELGYDDEDMVFPPRPVRFGARAKVQHLRASSGVPLDPRIRRALVSQALRKLSSGRLTGAQFRRTVTELASGRSRTRAVNNAVYLSFHRARRSPEIQLVVQSIDLERQAKSSRRLAVDFTWSSVLR